MRSDALQARALERELKVVVAGIEGYFMLPANSEERQRAYKALRAVINHLRAKGRMS